MHASATRLQRVLVVDDQAHCCDLMVRLLSADGFSVDVAVDGESALGYIAEHAPDVVVLDIGLPDINGIDLCRAIKRGAGTRLTPVVLVTGLADREHRLAGIEAGADDVLAKPFDTDELRARLRSLVRVKRITDDMESAEAVLVSLALTVEARDAYTEGHCERLARYAVALGAELGLDETDLAALRRGGLLHDVGKVGVADSLLLKPGSLTPDEYDLVKKHVIIGERLLFDLRTFAAVRPIVRSHHERLDGSGYPDGLTGADVPLLAQIVAIADIFDAVTTDRPYRAARSTAAACAELGAEARRGLMSRDLVEAFIRVLGPRRGRRRSWSYGKMPSSM